MELRICSKARPAANMAKVLAKGTMPAAARPAGTARVREIRWEKLDNTAHLFPVIANERMSNVYRVSVTLHEMVKPELLQQALNIVLPKFDGMNLRLRRGVFWNYFEENSKEAPVVKEETSFPCRYIRSNSNNSYLFRVSYYEYRINVEIFHALTDGMGALNFLRELTYQYLRLVYPQLKDESGDSLATGTTLNREDSFLKNYKRPSLAMYPRERALLIKGEHLREGEFGVMHGYLNIPELKTVCRRYGVTINEYLVAAYVYSIYKECLHGMPSDAPIRVAVPVNLRPYFDSITTKNFFVMISAEFWPKEESYSFADVMKIVQGSLRSQLERENLERTFSYNVSRQKSLFLRLLPLPLKNLGMRLVYTRSALANTSTVSNVGVITVSDAYKPHIDAFHVYMAISKGQHMKGTICSYGDTLTFTFSYDLKDVSVQRCFFRTLAADGLHVEIESNGVHYG